MLKSFSKYLLSLGLVLLAAGNLSVSKAQGFTFTLHSLNTGLCIGIDGDDPNRGGNLITWPCNGELSQIWDMENSFTVNSPLASIDASGQLSNYAYTLESQFNVYLVAGVQGNVMQPGTPIITWTEDPENFSAPGLVDNQGWVWQYQQNDQNGAPCYAILNAGGIVQGPDQGGNTFALTDQSPWVVISPVEAQVGYHAFPYTNQVWCMYPAYVFD